MLRNELQNVYSFCCYEFKKAGEGILEAWEKDMPTQG